MYAGRGGLAPQIFKGLPKKKKKIAAKTKLLTYKGPSANFSWPPDRLRRPQTRGAPWEFSHLVIWPVRPCMQVEMIIVMDEKLLNVFQEVIDHGLLETL
jgi:hypothetical protein